RAFQDLFEFGPGRAVPAAASGRANRGSGNTSSRPAPEGCSNLAFLDERADRPRRPEARRPPRRTAGGDNQTIRARRITAAVIGVVVLILLFIGIKACLSSQKEQAFKDYVSNVKEITQQSNNESKQF